MTLIIDSGLIRHRTIRMVISRLIRILPSVRHKTLVESQATLTITIRTNGQHRTTLNRTRSLTRHMLLKQTHRRVTTTLTTRTQRRVNTGGHHRGVLRMLLQGALAHHGLFGQGTANHLILNRISRGTRNMPTLDEGRRV